VKLLLFAKSNNHLNMDRAAFERKNYYNDLN